MLISGKGGRRGRPAVRAAARARTAARSPAIAPAAPVVRAQAGRTRADGRRAGGFTLIELLVVMGILLVLAGIITSTAFAFKRTMLKRAAGVDIQAFTMGLAAYKRDLGSYPPADITLIGVDKDDNGLNEVIHYYLGRRHEKGANFYGPYVMFKTKRLIDGDVDGFKEYLDPWGGLYKYALNASGGYDIVSPGPDGELGGKITVADGYVPAETVEEKEYGKDDVTQRSK